MATTPGIRRTENLDLTLSPINPRRKNNSASAEEEKEFLLSNDKSPASKTSFLSPYLKQWKEALKNFLGYIPKPFRSRVNLYFRYIHYLFSRDNTIAQTITKGIIHFRNLATSKRFFLIPAGILLVILHINKSVFLVHQNGDVHLHPHSFFSTIIDRNHHLAAFQSYGLFHDIKNEDWKQMKQRVQTTKPHRNANTNVDIDEPNVWYHYNWNADFTCPFAERVGGVTSSSMKEDAIEQGWLGDGPKWVCNPKSIVQMVRRRMNGRGEGFFRGSKNPPTNGCLIYSIGVNGQELEFEHSIQRLLTQEAASLDYEMYGHYDARHGEVGEGKGGANTNNHFNPFCEIHVFDPDGWHKKLSIGEGIYYHDWGIRQSDVTGIASDNIKFKTFQDTVQELGHTGYAIDIMKVDCKLCEWDIYQDWFDGETYGEKKEIAAENVEQTGGKGPYIIHQLLVEVHGTPINHVNRFFDRIREENYVIFHKEPNTQTFGGTCQDYAFLKLRHEFFE